MQICFNQSFCIRFDEREFPGDVEIAEHLMGLRHTQRCLLLSSLQRAWTEAVFV